MTFREDYIFWKLASIFISNQGYRIIQLFENQKELWLEKLENKKAPIIRLTNQEFNWSNSMQRDIEFSAANGEKIRKQLGRSELNLVNIYISPFPPVDDYEFRLASPYIFPEGNKTSVHSILLTSGGYEDSLQKLSIQLEYELSFPINDEYSEEDAVSQKKHALEAAAKRAKAEKEIFSNGKPFFTYAFIIIQIAVFILLEMQGGSTNTSTLIKYGAKFNPYIYEGEWWRFITPIFLHIGFLHLALNSLALYYIGGMVERIFGNVRFLIIYLFAGITGVIASFLFSPNVSAGASGAIYGCFGGLLYFCVINPKLFFRTLGPSIFPVLILNLVIGFTVPVVDNAGHLGGLAGGFLAAGMIHFPKKKKSLIQLLFLLISIAVVYGSLSYGFNGAKENGNETSNLLLAQEYVKQEKYDQAYEILKKLEENDKSPSVQLYFDLSFIEIKLSMHEDAKVHLNKVIQMNPDISEAYFNLALILFEENNLEQAKANAEKAVELEPNRNEYTDVLQEINLLLQSSDGGE